MKQVILIFIFGMLSAFSHGQESGLTGTWQNEAGNRVLEFYHNGKNYEGKIISDPRPEMIGKVVFTKLKFNGKAYEGTGYLPARNKYITCSLKLTSVNSLDINGKYGFISDTKTWKRLK